MDLVPCMSFGELDWVPEMPYPDSGQRFKITQLFHYKSSPLEPETIKMLESPQTTQPKTEAKKYRRRRRRKSHCTWINCNSDYIKSTVWMTSMAWFIYSLTCLKWFLWKGLDHCSAFAWCIITFTDPWKISSSFYWPIIQRIYRLEVSQFYFF